MRPFPFALTTYFSLPPQVLEALDSGLIKVDDLITSKIKLEDVVNKGLLALKHEEHHIKILVDLESSS